MIEKRVFVDSSTVLFGLLMADKNYYVDMSRINKAKDYLYSELVSAVRKNDNVKVVFDVDTNSIAREVIINSKLLELQGERIYLKDTKVNLARKITDMGIYNLIEKFVQSNSI